MEVNAQHTSRLANPGEGFYYVSVVTLQLLGYTLATASGLNLGWSYLRPAPYYRSSGKMLGFPREAIMDVLRIYAIVIPVLLVASLWESLSPLCV